MSEATSVIEFEGVSKSFPLPDGGEQDVLQEVSFVVPQGETVAIMGRSGVGKSVTLKHIIGFLEPDSGRVLIQGQDAALFSEEEWAQVRRGMAMVFQSGALFDSLSVAENVAFPMVERSRQNGEELDEEEVVRRVRELLETVELEEQAEAMPSELSMGMRRAVAIARALAAEPACILYDEPTTLVDPLMAQTITGLIERLKEKYHKTSIVVTHDVRLAERVADRIVMLHQGRVAFFGTPEEWRTSREPEVEAFRALDTMPGAQALSG
jgi:phospholipid/cholesterol/gamma-HCH transport system ATP-binding protein